MKKTLAAFLVILGLLAPARAQDAAPLPEKEDFYIFILAGQSNMAGRGHVEDQDKVPHPRVLMLSKQGKWVPAVDPIHYDKSAAGVGPGRTFAMAMAEQYPDATIGLVPTACGGSSIESWVPGGYHDQTKSHPYDDAMKRAQRAMQDGTVKGILWHQGESDGKPGRSDAYEENLRALIERFRAGLGQPELPFIIGQLGQFPAKPWNQHRKAVDAAQKKIAADTPNIGFVSSDDLTPNSDNVHFDAESQREFGRRYAEVYLEVIGEEDATSSH